MDFRQTKTYRPMISGPFYTTPAETLRFVIICNAEYRMSQRLLGRVPTCINKFIDDVRNLPDTKLRFSLTLSYYRSPLHYLQL